MRSCSATYRGRPKSTAIQAIRLLSLPELMSLHERISLPRRRAAVACIALNTRHLDDEEARAAVTAAEAETGLVADDPVRFGSSRLLDALLAHLSAIRALR